MSLSSLEAALGVAAAQINPVLPHYSSLFEEDGITPKRFLPHWITEPVKQEIEKTPELSEFAKSWIRTPGSGQSLASKRCVGRLAGRSGGFARLRVSRRSAPLALGARRKD